MHSTDSGLRPVGRDVVLEAAAVVSTFGARCLRQCPGRPALAGTPPILITHDVRGLADPAPVDKAVPFV